MDLKEVIKAKGWSYRKLAKLLRLSYQHISEVTNGHRHSKKLEEHIKNLPSYDFFIKCNPDFFENKTKKRKVRPQKSLF